MNDQPVDLSDFGQWLSAEEEKQLARGGEPFTTQEIVEFHAAWKPEGENTYRIRGSK